MALYVVTGPPAAGKTTWVQQHAKHGDIVVDLDALACALTTGGPTHQHHTPVLRTAQRARAAAVDEALRHVAEVDVYLIHTLPSDKAMARYAEHRARVVTIDPGRDVVDRRIDEHRPRSARAVAARWYATHREHQPSDAPASRQW